LRGLLADNFKPKCPELENRLNIIAKSLQIAAWLAVLCGFAARAGAAQPTIEETIAATKSADESARLTAIQDLGTRGGAPAIAALTELLKADSPITRAYAARALGTVGAPAREAAESLIALLGDSDPVVRRQAMAAIAAIRPGPKVTVPLFARLMQDSDPGIRLRVMQAVADAKAAAIPALVEALNNESAAYWACLILRDIGPDAAAAVPALVDKLNDSDPEIRREAILALAAIGSPEAVPKITSLLKDETARTAATFALGVLGKIPADAEATVQANAKSSDGLLSTTSLWALARLHPNDMNLKRAALTQIVARLKDQDPFVRTAAARALASLPPSPEIAGPIFEKAMADGDETTTQYMLDALATLGPQAVPRLIAALKHPSLRGQTAYILGQIGPAAAAATPALAKLLADPDPNVAIEAAHALAKIGPAAKAAVPALIDAIKQPESKSAHAAVFALGMIGPGAVAAEPVLLELIEAQDTSESMLAAWAIVKMRGVTAETAAKVVPELLVGLDSPLVKTRQHAAESLGELGSLAKKAVEKLERATKDEDEGVRSAAAKALKAIRG
jgi:HEAT repeat protein